ncbi:hypothetical protein CK820_G0053552 [Pan troglodytes]|uniref:Uncharacterized protein n=1 Tax=Pan troglodytes TaxID=9598 RepID=A0A2J8PWS8_PANTR|nr:hypothetical protein CK820_G0053552 [Pan troglodytes]
MQDGAQKCQDQHPQEAPGVQRASTERMSASCQLSRASAPVAAAGAPVPSWGVGKVSQLWLWRLTPSPQWCLSHHRSWPGKGAALSP